jgi:hypothetical protein
MKQRIHTILLTSGLALAPAFAQDSAPIAQAGASAATIRQDGGGSNQASISQSALGAGAAGTPGAAAATISQSGNFNAASIDQHGGAAAEARVTQQGERNRATITQEGADRAPVMADQSGADNVAIFNQSAAAGSNGMTVQQFGNGNFASFGAHGPNSATAWARQGGDFNTVYIDQAGELSQSSVLQAGSRNRVQVTLDAGRLSNFYAEQVGSGDAVRASQSHVVGSAVSLSQHDGDGNTTQIQQHDGSGLEVSSYQVGNDHVADIDQTGENVSTFTNQMGAGNTLAVRQVGLLPERSYVAGINVDQRGVANAASVMQNGLGGTASVQQFGDGNRAGIVQGAASFDAAAH